jgi:uncharacterized membrane protein HdeD (DUF308 family)
VSDFQWKLKLGLGVVMVALGSYVAVRPLLPNNSVLTSARWLDMTFAAVFMLRGAVNVRSALRTRRSRAG